MKLIPTLCLGMMWSRNVDPEVNSREITWHPRNAKNCSSVSLVVFISFHFGFQANNINKLQDLLTANDGYSLAFW